jgi:hypothetical protein
MNETKKRTERITFRCTPYERKVIESKATAANYSHCGEYIRRQLLDGQVLQLNEKFYADIMRQVSGIGNNVNQIAWHVNRVKSLRPEQVVDLRKALNEYKVYTDLMVEAVRKLYGSDKA